MLTRRFLYESRKQKKRHDKDRSRTERGARQILNKRERKTRQTEHKEKWGKREANFFHKMSRECCFLCAFFSLLLLRVFIFKFSALHFIISMSFHHDEYFDKFLVSSFQSLLFSLVQHVITRMEILFHVFLSIRFSLQ
jgi:hypothetical protein